MTSMAQASTATPTPTDQRSPHSATTTLYVPSVGCRQLDGQCVSHQDDHGTTIHRGTEHTIAAGDDGELLSHTLIQWGDDETPGLQFVGGYTWPQLDLAQTDDLIAAVEKQLESLRQCRTHLAAALTAEQVTA